MKIKRLLTVCLVLCSCASFAEGFFAPEYIKSLYRTAGEQFLALNEERNIIVSPASLALGCSYLCVGAGEADSAACASALGMPSADVLLENSVKARSFADKAGFRSRGIYFFCDMWLMKGLSVSDKYSGALKGYFGLQPGELPETEPLRHINSHYREFTGGKLTRAADTEEPEPLIITGGASVTPLWDMVLPEKYSRVDFFHPYNTTPRAVIYFPVAGSFAYKENSEYLFVSIPFADGTMCMDIICPRDRKAMHSVADQLSRGYDFTEGTVKKPVRVYLPSAAVESIEHPLEALEARGMKTLGYSHILGKRPVPVEQLTVCGQLRLEPAKGSSCEEALLPEGDEISLTGPFMFTVRDSKYSLPLLVGLCLVCK